MKPVLCNRDKTLYVTDCTPRAYKVRGSLEVSARLEGVRQTKQETDKARELDEKSNHVFAQ